MPSAFHHATAAARTIACNDRCDPIVATVATHGQQQAAIEPGLELLSSSTVPQWAELTLGL